MDRLPISANVPAELAERLSDVADSQEEPYFDDPVYVAAVVPKDLAKPIADLVAAKGCDVAVYEQARAAVEKALHTLWSEL